MNSAEQYRALVDRLESIMLNEEEFPKLRIGDIDPRNGKKILDALVDGSGYVVRSRFGDIWNVKYGEPDKKEEPPKPMAAEPEKKVEPEVKPEPEKKPEAEPPKLQDPEVVQPVKEPEPEVKCGPEVQAEIKRQKTFSAAFALARKSGCETFDWCQIVKVPGQAPTPTPQPVQGVTTNPMGDFDPTAFSGDFTGGTKREDIELEESAFIPGSEEIDRIREIAGTLVVEANVADIAREQGLMMGKPKDPNTKCTACGRTWAEHTNPDGSSKVRHPFFYKAESGQAQTPAPAASKPTAPAKTNPGTIPEIKASTKEKAIEIARKQGIKVFRFCGKYGTNLGKKKPPKKQDVTPVPKRQPVQGVTTNPMGDFDPTAFSGDFTGGTKR